LIHQYGLSSRYLLPCARAGFLLKNSATAESAQEIKKDAPLIQRHIL